MPKFRASIRDSRLSDRMKMIACKYYSSRFDKIIILRLETESGRVWFERRVICQHLDGSTRYSTKRSRALEFETSIMQVPKGSGILDAT